MNKNLEELFFNQIYYSFNPKKDYFVITLSFNNMELKDFIAKNQISNAFSELKDNLLSRIENKCLTENSIITLESSGSCSNLSCGNLKVTTTVKEVLKKIKI